MAGSMGMTGAALLSAAGALRAGAGLVRLYVTPDIHPIIAAAAPPEIMVQSVNSFREVPGKSDVIAVGPGLGQQRGEEVLHLMETAPVPMVVDADALNVLAPRLEILRRCAGPRLLTPHPGEMARLADTKGQTRSDVAARFVHDWPITLLLKGARTIVAERGRPLNYNPTGNPGMGTGGMGDVLTGVCAALIGQGLSPYDAASAGAWLCGRAVEIAVFDGGQSEESLVATDVIAHLGRAFGQLRAGVF